MSDNRSIDDYHRTRVSGAGCPETDGGPHYFAFGGDGNYEYRSCIDCGEPKETA